MRKLLKAVLELGRRAEWAHNQQAGSPNLELVVLNNSSPVAPTVALQDQLD